MTIKKQTDLSSFKGTITKLPPDEGLSLKTWLKQQELKAVNNRRSNRTPSRSRSPFIVRGEGCI